MVCFLASLREVSPELHAPGLDALMVGVDTLGQAPVALEHLEFHIQFSDWRVLNLLQVREAATLWRVLIDAEQALANCRLALFMLAAATKAVQSAAGRLRRHASHPARLIGRDALQISVAGAIGSDAQLREINDHLVAVRAATAHPTQGAGELLAEMDRAMVFLRRANRRLERGLGSLDAVLARFDDMRGQATLAHALTRVSPAIAAIATSLASSLRRLLRAIRASNAGNHVGLLQLLAGLRRDLRARTAMRFELDFHRFSGPLEVRSRRDLAELSAMSRPHNNESGVPRRRVVIVIGGIDSLLEANAIRHVIDAGVQERGWIVYGLGSLSTAQALHSRIQLLTPALGRLLDKDVMDEDDDAVLGPEYFTQAQLHAAEVLHILDEDSTMAVPKVRLLAQDVCDLAIASRAPQDIKNPLRTSIHHACIELRFIQSIAILFLAGA